MHLSPTLLGARPLKGTYQASKCRFMDIVITLSICLIIWWIVTSLVGLNKYLSPYQEGFWSVCRRQIEQLPSLIDPTMDAIAPFDWWCLSPARSPQRSIDRSTDNSQLPELALHFAFPFEHASKLTRWMDLKVIRNRIGTIIVHRLPGAGVAALDQSDKQNWSKWHRQLTLLSVPKRRPN